jgi:propanol-preferring alcohol dehydrogenase
MHASEWSMVLERPAPIASRPLIPRRREEPTVGPGEVLIDVEACAVCRTDLQLVEGDLPAVTLPVVPGHQVVGIVRAVGPGRPAVHEGDRVGVAWLAASCGACRFCVTDRENLCEHGQFTGWHRDGGYAHTIVADQRFVHLLPAGADPITLAPLLCGGAIGYRSLRVAGVENAERVGLYGFGASASIVIQIARHWGCEVAVATRQASEQERARTMGACWVGSYEDAPPFPLDRAITFAPSGDVVVAALRALGRGGVVAVNAIHLDRIPSFEYRHLWWERSLRSVANVTRQDVRDVLSLAAEIPLRTAVRTYGVEQANEALHDLRAGTVGEVGSLARASSA